MTALLDVPRNAAATALGLATAARGSRVFHPRGVARSCRLTVTGGLGLGAEVLDRPAAHDGLVRLSRAAGLPRPLPDVDALALRLPGQGSGGEPLDLLISSAWRFVFAPTPLSATWSAVLPHRTASGRLVLLGARPDERGFVMLAAAPLGTWHRWGHLALGEALPEEESERLRFAPTLGADDLRPVQLFRGLRARSYERSQAHRP
jgi:hypothetical protein